MKSDVGREFSLKLEGMLNNGRSKGRVQAVLTGYLAMEVIKVGGGNSSVESAVEGYCYALKCAGMLEK